MSTSPYHIASLLDKVRRVKFCFFTAIVVCARGLVRAGKTLQNVNAGCFDRSIGFYVVLHAPRYIVGFQFFLGRDLSRSTR